MNEEQCPKHPPFPQETCFACRQEEIDAASRDAALIADFWREWGERALLILERRVVRRMKAGARETGEYAPEARRDLAEIAAIRAAMARQKEMG